MAKQLQCDFCFELKPTTAIIVPLTAAGEPETADICASCQVLLGTAIGGLQQGHQKNLDDLETRYPEARPARSGRGR